MKKVIIGVDVSAKTLDICVKDENKLSNLKIDNTIFGIARIFFQMVFDI